MVRTEEEVPDFTPIEKLQKKLKYYPANIKLPWIRKVYDDGKYNKCASGRFEKVHVSTLSAEEVEMVKNAPESNFTGFQVTDKNSNVYWVHIENGIVYRGNGAGASITSARMM